MDIERADLEAMRRALATSRDPERDALIAKTNKLLTRPDVLILRRLVDGTWEIGREDDLKPFSLLRSDGEWKEGERAPGTGLDPLCVLLGSPGVAYGAHSLDSMPTAPDTPEAALRLARAVRKRLLRTIDAMVAIEPEFAFLRGESPIGGKRITKGGTAIKYQDDPSCPRLLVKYT